MVRRGSPQQKRHDEGHPTIAVIFEPCSEDGNRRAPYATTSPGGVRVAATDLTGDGRAEIIIVPGPGREPELKVFSRATSALLSTQQAFQPTYTGGVFVSASPARRLGTPVTNWIVT